MGKKFRKLLIAVLCMIAAVGCLFAVGCSDKDDPRPSGTTYTVTVEAADHGTVTPDKTAYAAGATVTLTVKPDSGYELAALTLKGEALTVTGGKATFKMPAENVTVSAVFVEEGMRTITVADAVGATVRADKKTAKEGDTVKLTVTTVYGYDITSLKMNDTDLTVEDGKAEFTMPDANVNITVTTALAADLKQGAAPEAQLSLDATVASKTATAKLIATYGDDKFTVAAYVTDERIIADKDALELYFGREGYAYTRLSNVNKGVKAYAGGDVDYYEVDGNAYATASDGVEGLNAKNVQPWSVDGKTVEGYYIEVEIAYTALGFESKADAENKISVLPVLNNYFSTVGDTIAYKGLDKAAPNTYPVIKNGEWTDNAYEQGTGLLGSYGSLKAGTQWNLTNDRIEEDPEYADRYVTLDGHEDGTDNNIMFYRAAGESVYAEATFEVTALYDRDGYRKFGLMLFDGANQQGVFYFVEANTTDDTTHNLSDITGNGIGKNVAANGWSSAWDSIKSGVFSYNKPFTMKMAYDGDAGIVYFWYVDNDGNDVLATKAFYDAKGTVVMGFKSFKTGLKVTNYYSTNDKTDPKFAAHMEEVEETTGALGDGGKIFHGANWNLENDYPEGHDNYANRKAVLDGSAGDNDIVFIASEGKSSYVRATFRVDNVLNGEKWGKFGLMLFDGASQNGLFYYVDAYVGESADGVIRGTGLGYNYAPRGWAAWTGIAATGGAFNTTTKTITLAMTYDNDVISMYYLNAAGDDVLAAQLAHAHTTGAYAIGIKSFNYTLTVTNYTVNTDTDSQDFKDHNPALTGEDIDVLFAGDSYMEFWKNYGVWDTLTYDMTSQGMKLVNVGIGGTRIHEWNNEAKINTLKLSYDPDKIVFHIGVNDIDSGDVTVDETYSRLNGLLTEYHKAFPSATIYWVSCIPNNFYIKGSAPKTTYNADYSALNAKAKTLMDGLDYAVYIDMETPFTAEDGDARSTYLHSTDGLHINANYGYPLWTAVIKRALGFTLSGDDEQYLMGNTDIYAATPAWTYGTNGNIAEIDRTSSDFDKSVKVEESIYYKAAPAADLLFEAEIRSSGKYNADDYSKVGVVLANEYITIFAYFETANGDPEDGAKTSYASMVVRPTFYNTDGDYNNRKTGIGDWVWGEQRGAAITVRNVKTTFSKLGIAKRGSTVYLLVDGISVASWTDIDLESCWNASHNGYGSRHGATVVTAASKFTAGVMTFNRNVEIKSVNYTTDTAEIDYTLAAERTITVPAYDDTTITVDGNKTVAKRGDSISFSVTADGIVIDKVYVTYGGEDHELTVGENSKYTFTMPDENVSIKVTFQNMLSITLDSGVAEKITASRLSIAAGGKVTFTAKDGWYIGELYANETAIVKNGDGVYELTVNEDVNITGVFYEVYDGVILDAVLDDAYGTAYTESLLNDNRNMQVWAKKTANGVVIYAMSHSNTYKDDDAGIWYNNSNFEFYLNNGGQNFINSRSQSSANIKFFTSYKQINDAANAYNGKWENIYEIYVAKEHITNFDAGNIQLNYAFKTGNDIDLVGNESDYNVNGAVNRGYDWWGHHGVGGCGANNDWFIGFNNANVRPANLFITDNGISIVRATATDAVIDGEMEASVWESKSGLSLGDDVTHFDVKGFAGSDGLYLGMVITHGAWSNANPSGDWSTHDNVEIQINGVNETIVFVAGRLIKPVFYDQGAAKTVEVDGKLVTTVELFAKGASPLYRLQMGCNGDGFKGSKELGWQSLLWDNDNGYITAGGLSRTSTFTDMVNSSGVNMNGELDEPLWTDSVKAKTITTTANGANISIMGVNTDFGIMMGVTVVHSKPDTESIQGNGLEWWNYLNVECRIAHRNDTQIAVSVYNNGAAGCGLGRKTVDNGDGTYTTTFEIFIDYMYCGCVKGEPIAISFGGVFETGFSWLFGGDASHATHYVTADGMVPYSA